MLDRGVKCKHGRRLRHAAHDGAEGTKLARSAIMRARSVAGGSVTASAAAAKAAGPVSAAVPGPWLSCAPPSTGA